MLKFCASLKFRFSIGIATMLLPLLVFAGGTFLALQESNEAISEIADEIAGEIPPVSQLKSMLLMAQMPPNDYLISNNLAEQSTFNYFVEQIDNDLFTLQSTPLQAGEEKLLMDLIREHWGEAKELALLIFAIPQPQDDPRTDELMEEFDGHIGKCASMLNQLEHYIFREIELNQQRTESHLQTFFGFLAGTLLAGLIIAAATGVLLARMVLTPLKMLDRGAGQISRGEFKLLTFPHRNEFSKVFETFNAMAVSLKKNQAALKDMAMRDGLTGLLNRREFRRLLTQEIDRARRGSTQVSLIILDIDHFKKINDSHGHQVGDEVLRSLATLLTEQIRTMDHLARYGGEEFVIVVPEGTRAANRIAERIREAVAASTHSNHRQEAFGVSVSLGIATCPNHTTDQDELIRKADEALYRAKQGGRNRVCTCNSVSSGSAKVISFTPPGGTS